MRTPEGTGLWYLSAIHRLAQAGAVLPGDFKIKVGKIIVQLEMILKHFIQKS